MKDPDNQQTRALALLAGNGAALAMVMQFTITQWAHMTPNLAVGIFPFLCFTLVGVAISYLALRSVGKPGFLRLELYAVLMFSVHIVSLAVGLIQFMR